jgi:hypothetical protein
MTSITGVLGYHELGILRMQYKATQKNPTRALYEVLKLGRHHNLSIKCQLDLFNKMVKPVLLYGCEIWVIMIFWKGYI